MNHPHINITNIYDVWSESGSQCYSGQIKKPPSPRRDITILPSARSAIIDHHAKIIERYNASRFAVSCAKISSKKNQDGPPLDARSYMHMNDTANTAVLFGSGRVLSSVPGRLLSI
jgi:hypothetical protein